jgi:hypothetical protein
MPSVMKATDAPIQLFSVQRRFVTPEGIGSAPLPSTSGRTCWNHEQKRRQQAHAPGTA